MDKVQDYEIDEYVISLQNEIQNIKQELPLHPINLFGLEDINKPTLEQLNILHNQNVQEFEFKKNYHINELLAYHDVTFLEIAYLAILHRKIDSTGLQFFLKQIRAGLLTKVEILKALCCSPEGVKCGVHIIGLRYRHLSIRIKRIPIVGYFYELMLSIINLPKRNKNIQCLEAYINAHLYQTNQALSALNAKQLALENSMFKVSHLLKNKVTDFNAQKSLIASLYEKSIRVLKRLQQLECSVYINKEPLQNSATLSDKLETSLPISVEKPYLDSLYFALENQFRGSRELIYARLKVYLPHIMQLMNDQPIRSALDLGCGRGEWLQLMQEQGIPVKGIDSNHLMVTYCQTLSLDAIQENVFTYLNELNDNSVDLITSFHLIEHLPFELLLTFYEEILRVLRPGGMLILETPNPENLFVGACNFHYDPTHNKPLPPNFVRFLLETKGFVKIEILRMNEHRVDPVKLLEIDHPLTEKINQLIALLNGSFFAPPDYAIIAYK